MTVLLFFIKIPWRYMKCEAVGLSWSTTSSFVAEARGKVIAIFQAVVVKRHSSMRKWLCALPAVANSLWTITLVPKKSYEHALGFVLLLFRLLRFRWVWTFRVWLMVSFSNTSVLLLPGSPSHFSEVCTTFNAVPLRDPARNRIRPKAWLQIKGHKKLPRPPSFVKFSTLTPKVCWYCTLPLHRATATALQMAAPIQEIMNIPSYKLHL
jgi:hypothetical protein